MAKRNLKNIAINATTLGGLNSDYYMSCWTSLSYAHQDWNDAKETRVYNYNLPSMELANAPKGLTYSYGLLLCFFNRSKDVGVQICIPHNAYREQKINPIYRLYYSTTNWSPWETFTTLGDLLTQNYNTTNMQLTDNQSFMGGGQPENS